MKKFFIVLGKCLSVLLLLLVAVLALFSVSPVYDFSAPRPFSGPDIFNPYAALGQGMCDDAARCEGCGKTWKRANFHTHTRVRPFLSECDFWPGEVLAYYDSLGYDIVTFSNHNALTVHPNDTALQVNVYEHGYNLFKYHLLVFGSDRVNLFDPLLPVLVSQRQWKLDMLGRDSDFIQLNHPFRTWMTPRDDMECLSGYEIMELDSGVTTEQEYWDLALSAGHYSFALANDDLHHPDRSWCIGMRSNMLYCGDGSYASLKETLLGGAYYCMRMPDYGAEDVAETSGFGAEYVAGDTAEVPGRGTLSGVGGWVQRKRAGIAAAPRLTGIGAEGDSLFVAFSETASTIPAIGQGGRVLASAENSGSLSYVMDDSDTYVRFTAYFDAGTVIYTNPFARYDRSAAEASGDAGISSRPALPGSYFHTPHSVNWPLTILWNLL
ncbi:MAG: hypothetical protein MJY55_04830, partial [Bacteroidales bacterium]|nr:hypothetical protein [Bacteroidales bacterium]